MSIFSCCAGDGNVVVKPTIIFKTTASPPTTVGVAAIHECLCLWCKSEAAGILVEPVNATLTKLGQTTGISLQAKIPTLSTCMCSEMAAPAVGP